MAKEQRSFNRALVLEDDPRLNASLCSFLMDRGIQARACSTVARGLHHITDFDPDLLLLDFQLEDGDAKQLLEKIADLSRWPMVIAISGEAQASDAFDLAQLGVRTYLSKPIAPAELAAALEVASNESVDLIPAVRGTVGLASVHEVQQLVRDTMLVEAMGQAKGSRSAAARMLKVSRQLVQHMLRAMGEGERSVGKKGAPSDDDY